MHAVAERAARAKAGGRLSIPLGASTPLGALGFALAIGELRRADAGARRHRPRDVVGRHAGGPGRRLPRCSACRRASSASAPTNPPRVAAAHGARDHQRHRRRCSASIRRSLARGTAIEVDDRFVGDGYGIPTPRVDARRSSWRRGPRASFSIRPTPPRRWPASSRDPRRRVREPNVLFWHTGGQVALCLSAREGQGAEWSLHDADVSRRRAHGDRLEAPARIDGTACSSTAGCSRASRSCASATGRPARSSASHRRVVLTHAHLDHCGYLPRLVARLPRPHLLHAGHAGSLPASSFPTRHACRKRMPSTRTGTATRSTRRRCRSTREADAIARADAAAAGRLRAADAGRRAASRWSSSTPGTCSDPPTRAMHDRRARRCCSAATSAATTGPCFRIRRRSPSADYAAGRVDLRRSRARARRRRRRGWRRSSTDDRRARRQA